jgi:hypothetical protein
MRVLLDESVQRKLGSEIPGHFVQSVHNRGWAGLKNGELLRTGRAEFDVLVAGDLNLEYQQNPAALQLAMVVLIAVNNGIETLQPLVPELLRVLQSVRSGQVIHVGGA